MMGFKSELVFAKYFSLEKKGCLEVKRKAGPFPCALLQLSADLRDMSEIDA